MTNINITPPQQAETQTERIMLTVTPTLKRRTVEAAKRYRVSMNSMIAQLVDAGITMLEEKEAETRQAVER